MFSALDAAIQSCVRRFGAIRIPATPDLVPGSAVFPYAFALHQPSLLSLLRFALPRAVRVCLFLIAGLNTMSLLSRTFRRAYKLSLSQDAVQDDATRRDSRRRESGVHPIRVVTDKICSLHLVRVRLA